MEIKVKKITTSPTLLKGGWKWQVLFKLKPSQKKYSVRYFKTKVLAVKFGKSIL